MQQYNKTKPDSYTKKVKKKKKAALAAVLQKSNKQKNLKKNGVPSAVPSGGRGQGRIPDLTENSDPRPGAAPACVRTSPRWGRARPPAFAAGAAVAQLHAGPRGAGARPGPASGPAAGPQPGAPARSGLRRRGRPRGAGRARRRRRGCESPRPGPRRGKRRPRREAEPGAAAPSSRRDPEGWKMATDGASCEAGFFRGPEDAAGATAEATVTEIPGRARGECGRGPGSRGEPARSRGSAGAGSPGAPLVRRAPALGCPPAQWPGPRGARRPPGLGSPGCFPSLAGSSRAARVRGFLRASGAPCAPSVGRARLRPG